MILNNRTIYVLSFSLIALLMVSSCEEEDAFGDKPLPPVADFTYSADPDDSFTIRFTNTSLNADSYLWEFGDGSTSTEASPTHTFGVSGSHDVKLTIQSADNEDHIVKPVQIESPGGVPTGPNMLKGADMSDESVWTIGKNSESDPMMDYEFGASTLSWSAKQSGQQMHIWQAVQLEAGTKYLLAVQVSGPSLTNGYFQVTIGGVEPDPNADYNYDWTPNEGDECPEGLSGIDCNTSKVIGLNYWKGCATSAFDGNIVEFACDGPAQKRDENNPDDTNTSGVVSVPESGTYYLVIKGGWWGGGSDVYQITIDEVFLAAIQE